MRFTPILITGEMRSGTTFLSNLLNSQQYMIVYSDFLISLFSVGKARELRDVQATLSDLEKNLLVSNLNSEGMNIGINFDHLRSGKSWIDILYLALTTLSNESQEAVQFVGIKKTNEAYYLKQLVENAFKVIFVARDPRDVMLSMKNRFVEHSVFKSAERLKDNLTIAQSLEYHPNFLIVKYHDLILKKNIVKKSIENFLNTSLDFEFEELTMKKDLKYRDNSSFGDVNKLFDPNAVDRWRNQKNDDNVIFANGYFHEELKWLNLMQDHGLIGSRYYELIREYKKYVLRNRIKTIAKKWL